MLFDKVASVCFYLKNIFIFWHWKWPAQGTSTAPVVSAHFRSLAQGRCDDGKACKPFRAQTASCRYSACTGYRIEKMTGDHAHVSEQSYGDTAGSNERVIHRVHGGRSAFGSARSAHVRRGVPFIDAGARREIRPSVHPSTQARLQAAARRNGLFFSARPSRLQFQTRSPISLVSLIRRSSRLHLVVACSNFLARPYCGRDGLSYVMSYLLSNNSGAARIMCNRRYVELNYSLYQRRRSLCSTENSRRKEIQNAKYKVTSVYYRSE